METIQKIREQMNQYIVGKEAVVEKLLICLLAGGNVLLEDVPGVGKTTMIKALVGTIGASFGRIQFTPDTLPGDVLGTSVYNMKSGEFEYKEGVVMHQMLLADEINRTSPKTQACLLEAMAEKQVTVDGVRYDLPSAFMVAATQNPSEFMGTYPLPEAQLDRFMMKLTMGYPDRQQEIALAKNFLEGKKVEEIPAVCTPEDVLQMQKAVEKIHVSEGVLGYMQEIIALTRSEKNFQLGASPRAFLFLLRASQAKAYLEGREYVKPDDVKQVAVDTLHHRIVMTTEAKIRKEDTDKLLYSLVLKAKVPME